MQLKDIRGIVEYNSSYMLGALGQKFQDFIRNFDSLGLQIDGFKLDMGNSDTEMEESDILLQAMNESRLEDVPSVWVLVDDNELHPVFKPIISNADNVALDITMQKYGLDIVVLKTEISEIVKEVQFIIGEENLKFVGNLEEIQKTVIEYFEYKEVREEIFKQLAEYFYDKSPVISTFPVIIPKHFEVVVLKINS